jgi:hypothetical protein
MKEPVKKRKLSCRDHQSGMGTLLVNLFDFRVTWGQLPEASATPRSKMSDRILNNPY